ncbi:MAG TPA: response regulator [Thermoanaerobaculaceae bacterium]|nr:response regulator [Thermoanaerobaculaceae bacterium]
MGGMVLLADDSITIQKVVELTFAETEHKVVAVGSGRDLFKRLPEVKPDVVLCDVVMPDMNGYEVCQALKSDPATLHIPVVLLTGTFEPFDRDRALAAGCDGIVTKPFEARELINTVEDLIKRAQSLAAVPAEAGAVDHGIPEGVPALDFTGPGFENLKPPPPAPVPAPEDGIDLTASSLGKSNPPTPRAVPPELQEPAAPQAPPAFALGGEQPPAFGEPESAGVTPRETFVPPAAAEPGPGFSARESSEPPPPPVPPAVERPAPLESAALFTPPQLASPLPPERAMEEGPTQRFPVEPMPPAPAVAPPGGDVTMDEMVERIARRAMELLPQPPAATVAPAHADSLSDEQVDRIAKRVVELAMPQLERIAWEVIPDMAEMVVRKRIAELEAAAEEES